jgi:acetyl esterase/lipase
VTDPAAAQGVSDDPDHADHPDLSGVEVRRDVVHTRLEGYRPLSLDLYRPATGARAICVYVHGGGWLRGSRREGPGPLSPTSRRLFGRLAQSGLAVASVDYRLSGEARFPAQPEDVAAACRWLLDEEASPVHGLPLVLFGVSSGGQVAGLLGLGAVDRADRPDGPDRPDGSDGPDGPDVHGRSAGALPVRAVALWYPVTDLLALPDDIEAAGGVADRGPGSREARLLGGPAAERPELARAASPVTHARAVAPPFLLLHGDADRSVPARQSQRLHEALVAAGAQSTLDLVPGYDHMLTGIADADLEALVDRTAAFLLADL